jgi:hypothetical protein
MVVPVIFGFGTRGGQYKKREVIPLGLALFLWGLRGCVQRGGLFFVLFAFYLLFLLFFLFQFFLALLMLVIDFDQGNILFFGN